MASRRHPALPTLALAAAFGATALAGAVAAEHAACHQAGKQSVTAFPAGFGVVRDWNSMVPEGEHPVS